MFTEITEKHVETYEVNSYINKPIDEIKSELESNGINVVVIGDGNIITKQSVKKGEKITIGEKIFLVTNGKNKTIPNIIGWSRKDVVTLCNILGIKYNINGYGYVIEQNYGPLTPINNEFKLEVTLENRIEKQLLEQKEKENSEEKDEETENSE